MIRKLAVLACAVIFIVGSVAPASAGGSSEDLGKLLMRAEAGDVTAQTFLGLKYDLGDGVTHSPETAATWYQKAAEQGSADSQLYLGAAYAQGRGLPRNYLLSHTWLSRAVPQLEGQDRAVALRFLQYVRQRMPPAQVSVARRLMPPAAAGSLRPTTPGEWPAGF